MGVLSHRLQYVYICGGQETSCTSQFSSSTMCVLERELRLFGLVGGPLPTEPSPWPNLQGLSIESLEKLSLTTQLKLLLLSFYLSPFSSDILQWHWFWLCNCGTSHKTTECPFYRLLLFCSVTSVPPGQCLGIYDIWEDHSFLCSVLGYLITLYCIFIYFACECMWTMFHIEHMEVIGQHVRISPLLPCEAWKFSSLHKA